ncbi:MAG: hypothetical protein ACOYIG_11515 [Acetivibrionales bacterium]
MKTKNEWHFVPETIGSRQHVGFGTDTGQILIGDPCYIRESLNVPESDTMLRDYDKESVYTSSKAGRA